jgi:FkbM family methyltransferase
MYSQNNEEQVILDYFGNKIGNLLDIGANDGITLSNSRKLIELGWGAELIEPAEIPYNKLKELYKDNKKVKLHNIAISDINGEMTFYNSGEHLGNGDSDLLSTLSITDKQKWESKTEYKETKVKSMRWIDFNYWQLYDFINIDAEGYDLSILKQIDLIEVGCSCLCIEHNGHQYNDIMRELRKYNMKTLLVNNENLIVGI